MNHKSSKCKYCNNWIIWRKLSDKNYPFDASFDHNSRAYPVNQHICENRRFSLRVAGDIDTAIRHEWRDENVRLGQFDTDMLDAGDERIFKLLAETLTKEGAPFEAHTQKDVIGYFRRLNDGKAVLCRSAFNIVHSALHGSAMSVFGDMSDRKPVRIRGIHIEPE